MFKFNQLINNKFNIFDRLSIFVFSFLPISVLVGNAAINLNILVINIIFLSYCFKSKIWSWLKSEIFLILLFIYLFLITNSIYSYFFLTEINTSIENEIGGFVRSILFVKFILLVFAFSTLLENDKVLHKVKLNWLIILLIVITDVFYENYFGKNIFGYESPNPQRIVSFFKDEMVVGGFILCFGFTSITYFLSKSKEKKSTIFFLIVFLIIPIAIFLTGERSNFIKSVFLFFAVTFFIDKKNSSLNYKYLILLLFLAISCFFYSNENLKNRYSVFFKRVIIVEENKSMMEKFENIKYFAHFDTAIKILNNYPITGVGNKNFRKECLKTIYFEEKIKFSKHRCSTHPHQVHFEILSEHGLVGYFLIMYFIIIFLFKNIRMYLKAKNISHLSDISYIIIFFLPLLPGAGIFSTFNGIIFWIIFSLTYLHYKKGYLNNNKKILR
jgi:O-antigen ligase